MPIYAYRCESCGHAKDVLQKLSDAPLTECPACGQGAFRKQVTAAGFQLKGSGWYVTDFRNGNTAAAPSPAASGPGEGAAPSPSGGEATSSTSAAAAASSPAAPAAATGGACGGSCACH